MTTPSDPRSADRATREGPVMPERQSVLTYHARALTIAQAKTLIGLTFERPHWFDNITVNWRKSGTKTLDGVGDLDRLHSPDTVANIETHVRYRDSSNITLVLAFPKITAVAKPIENTDASQTLKRIQLELDRSPLPVLKPRFPWTSTIISMVALFAISYGVISLLNSVAEWPLLVNGALTLLLSWAIVFPAMFRYQKRNPPFRTWLSHHENPVSKLTRGEIITSISIAVGAIGIVATILAILLS